MAEVQITAEQAIQMLRDQRDYAKLQFRVMLKHCNDQLTYPPQPHWAMVRHLQYDQKWARDSLAKMADLEHDALRRAST